MFVLNPVPSKISITINIQRKIKLFNGALECKLLKYDLYKGSKKTNKPQSE